MHVYLTSDFQMIMPATTIIMNVESTDEILYIVTLSAVRT